MPLRRRLILSLAPIIVLILLLLTAYTQYVSRHQALTLAKTIANNIANKESTIIQTKLTNSAGFVENLAALSGHLHETGTSFDRASVRDSLKASISANLGFAGMASCWADFDGQNDLFKKTELGNEQGMLGAYWSRNDSGQTQFDQLQNFINEPYYIDPIKYGKTVLTEPYTDSTSGTPVLMVTVTTPIKSSGKAVGVSTADISLAALSEMMKKIQPYGTGYAYILSNKGVILAHADTTFVGQEATALVSVDPKTVLSDLQNKTSIIYEIPSGANNEKVLTSLSAFTLIEGQDPWFFGVVLPVDQVLHDVQRQFYLTLAICIAGIILAVGAIFFAANSISRPVQALATNAMEISKGNYTTNILVNLSCLELKDLATALKTMVTSLLASMSEAKKSKAAAQEETQKAQAAMKQAEAEKVNAEAGQQIIVQAAEKIEDVSTRLSAAAGELSAQVDNLGRTTEIQRNKVGASVAAMEQMNVVVQDVAHNASNASHGSETANNKAKQGAVIVKESIDAFAIVQENTASLHLEMTSLGKEAASIGNVITVINDIADQTNLLALNAAIEAARAGDAGRGFAVVADEVRKLAEKTMMATGEVSHSISAIQERATKSITALSLTTSNLSKATNHVEESGVSLTDIVAETYKTAVQIGSIATAVEEQSATSQHINSSLAEINESAEEMAHIVRESTQAVLDLSRQANELESLVSNLRHKN